MIDVLYKLISTLIYYGAFYGVAFFFFYKCGKSISNSKKSEFVYSALGIFTLCLFAGLRADTVGTDVQVYAIPTYKDAMSMDFSSFIVQKLDMIIFASLAYISAHLFNSFHVFLFLIQLSITYPIYKFLRNNENQISIELGMLIYMLIFFPMNFNIMRQSMACSILLLGVYYLQCDKIYKFVCCSIIAVLMHGTSAIGIILFLIAYSTKYITKKIILYIVDFIVVLAILVSVNNWIPLVNWLMYSAHILPIKVGYYVTVFSQNITGKDNYFIIGAYDYVSVIFRGVFVIVSLINLKKSALKNFYSNIVIVTFAIFSICLFAFHTSFSYRISMFTDYALIYTLGTRRKLIRGSLLKINKKDLMIVLLMLIYFFTVYFYFGAHGAVPYKIG